MGMVGAGGKTLFPLESTGIVGTLNIAEEERESF